MKNFKYLLSAVAVASALVACSSMDVDDEEALAGNFPEDFSDSAYINLHPELVRVQIKDYVTSYNKKLSDSVAALVDSLTAKCDKEDAACAAGAKAYKTAFDSLVNADTAAFFADTGSLRKIMTDPLIGGYADADWKGDWNVTYKKTDSVITQKVRTQFTIDSVAGTDTVKIMMKLRHDGDSANKGEYTCDPEDSTKITKIKGYRYEYVDKKWVSVGDSTALVEIEIKEGMSIDPKKGIASKTDTVGHVIDSVAVSGGLSKNHQKALKSLNLYGTNKDYELLKAVPIDTFAVSYQYVVYGRDYGWAYRRCTAEEVKKPAKTESYPVTKLYCADETGIAHEIN